MARKGEIWDVTDGTDARPARILVVSSDEWNDGGLPQCVEIVRAHGAEEVPPFLLLLNPDHDSMGGALVMDSLAPVPLENLARHVGSVNGRTLSRVDDALRKVYAL